LVDIKSVTAFSHPDSVYFSFIWADCTYKIALGDLASWWHLRRFDEENHVVATDFIMGFAKLAKSYGTSDGLVFYLPGVCQLSEVAGDLVKEFSCTSSVLLCGVE